jgi:hypothetical protein
MPEMNAAAVGGVILFMSILMFVTVAVGTLFTARQDYPEVAFAEVEPEALPTPAIFDGMWRWAVIALVLAVLAYVGPMHELVEQHVYGAPGMRTW